LEKNNIQLNIIISQSSVTPTDIEKQFGTFQVEYFYYSNPSFVNDINLFRTDLTQIIVKINAYKKESKKNAPPLKIVIDDNKFILPPAIEVDFMKQYQKSNDVVLLGRINYLLAKANKTEMVVNSI
jgi:hypothetical protein